MKYTESEVLQYVSENDIKFLKLVFCDVFGHQHNISIVARELENVFRYGIMFYPAEKSGFLGAENGLLLFPDPSSLVILPWRPQSGRVLSLHTKLKNADGSLFCGDTVSMLETAVKRLSALGIECKIGTDCEFYIFKQDDNGNPTLEPFDNGGYCDPAPLDRCENIRRDIILSLESMDIIPVSSHHEAGPGQNRISFMPADPLDAAHNFLNYKSTVKNICHRNGQYASFMPKPLANSSGSGMHISINLYKDGQNLFGDSAALAKDPAGASFLEGVLNRFGEITAFLNPSRSSYERLEKLEAGTYIGYSETRGKSLVRLKSGLGAAIEISSSDSLINPYLAFSLLLFSGAEGVEKKLSLREPIESQAKESLKSLPEDFVTAVKTSSKSSFIKSVVPEKVIAAYEEYAEKGKDGVTAAYCRDI